MQGISFQGRNLATAYQVWKKMLGDRVMIMMGMSGAMVPAGMRRLVVYLIKNRLIDCLVTTGANLFHDIHETLGRLHFQCSPNIDDVHLQKHLIDRMYDTLADEEEFREADAMIGRFAATLDQSRPYTTREFLYLLGKELSRRAKEDGIVTAAYRAGIPLYCPAVGDSSIGIGIAENRHEGKNRFTFDVIGDVLETAHLASDSPRQRRGLFRRRHAQELRAANGSDGGVHAQLHRRAQVCHAGRNRRPTLGRALGLHPGRSAKLGQDRSRRQHGDRTLRFHHCHARPGFGAFGKRRAHPQPQEAGVFTGAGTQVLVSEVAPGLSPACASLGRFYEKV